MKLAIVGTGYVGLVSGACLAGLGHEVVCVDLDEHKIAALNAGEIPIFEPGLEQLVADNRAAGRLSFTASIEHAVADARAVFISVGTPSRRSDGHADLSHVYAAAASIARAVSGFTVVVTKSTVPVGAGDSIEQTILQANPRADVAVVSNPEFLREGAAIEDFQQPDRIVVGVEDERAREVMLELYRPFILAERPVLLTDRRTAELTKYAANAFLAMKVTFINEIADLCERVGADVQDVARGIGLDRRISPAFLDAGPGYGGSCFPKDTLALVQTARDHDAPLRLVEMTIAVNQQRKHTMAEKIIAACGGNIRGKTVALLGLTFKPGTDDMRDAPSIPLVEALVNAGGRVRAFDPEGMPAARTVLQPIEYATDAYDAARGADALVLVTQWSSFLGLDLDRVRSVMSTPVFVDLRNGYRRDTVEAKGLAYHGIGKPSVPGRASLVLAAE
jgi:UDPglucose 6-dehydrogenase